MPIHTPTTQALVALCLLPTTLAVAQEWEMQAPDPTRHDLKDAAFITQQLGFISGDRQTLVRTRDGGRTWEEITLGGTITDPFNAIHFHDDLHGWVVGNNSFAHRTTDGGETWTRMTDLPGGSWREIVSFSPASAIITANGVCAATTDGGLSWQFRSGVPECPITYGMDFRDELVGLVSGDQGGPTGQGNGIYRTADGGRTWTKVVDQGSNDAVFMEGDRAIAHVYADIGGEIVMQVWYTDDAGLTWSNTGAFFGEDEPSIDLERIDADSVAAISAQGAIWTSNDGGFSWRKRQEPVGTLPYGWKLHFSDESHGYAMGPGGIIQATTNGGRTWKMIQSGGGFTATDLDMFDNQFGMAAAGNYVVRTRDGGNHWDLTRLVVTGPLFGRDENVAAVDFVSESTVVAGGAGGVVFQSLDGGDNWSSIGYPELSGFADVRDIDFVSETEGWVITDVGLYHTTDAFTWNLSLDFFGIVVQFINEDLGWMQMGGTRQWKTTDGGDSWTDTRLPRHPLYSVTSVEDMHFFDENHGWVVGWFGYVVRTTDGGRTWEHKDLGFPGDLLGFHVKALSPEEAYIAVHERDTDTPMLMHTTDGGDTWTREIVPTTWAFTTLTDFDVRPNGEAWMAGYQGEIFHKSITCRPDLDGDGTLTIFDFLAFQNAFDAGDPLADFDSDGQFTIFDFLTFQNEFDAGCE